MLLKSLENLSEYRAASANMQVVVDVEQDTDLVPSFIKGERTLFVAAGTVDAAVDFARPRRCDAVRVSDDRQGGHDHAAAGVLTEARLDTERSRVFDRDRGALDRIEEAFSDDGGADQQELYVLAETQADARRPRATRRCCETAERNTRSMLEGMMRGLGFEQVTIRFERPQV